MQYETDNIEHKSKRLWFSIVLLIILILLCIYFSSFGKITYATLMPTGNVDIFDITAGSKCKECETCEVCEDIEDVFEEIETPDNLDVIVYDDVDLIDNQINLRIFENAAFEFENNKIAPGVYNSYHFVVRNNNNYNVLYNLKIFEINIYNINMKFRLKVDGKYIYGSDFKWVRANELIRKNIELEGGVHHTYNLDWKWEDSDNDTYVGENAKEDYKLDINITARMKG